MTQAAASHVAERPFDRFILLAGMRTGSNFLEANLNAIPGIVCHGEAFNPHFIGKKDRVEHLGHTLESRDAAPLGFMAALEAVALPALTGFRFFHDHDPRVLAACLADRRCAKIVLTRNPLESYVSLKIARATGQWKLGDARRRKEALAEFDGPEFEGHLADLQSFQLEILHGLQTSGQTAFYLDYEDIGDLAVMNGLAVWLGVEGRLEALDDSVKKQNPEEIEAKVANPEQMAQALTRLDRFNLGRTPNFEPRRGPAIPSWAVAEGAPLLWMPVRGGPEAGLRDWMGRVARAGEAAGVREGLTQKELRQWLRGNPGHRSFTVLRHPLLRAYVAFADRILTGARPEARQVINRVWKLDLPRPADVGAMSDAGRGAAFLAFLRFLKGNLAGQTSVRIDPAWASQAAVVQGFAQFTPPDLILREDELAERLPALAAGVGAASPLPEEADTDPHTAALAAIVTPEIEEAAREAYQRDYMIFGFDAWSGSSTRA